MQAEARKLRPESALDRRGHVWLAVSDGGLACVFKTGPGELIAHEGRILAQLDHPNIVRCIDQFEEEDRSTLVLEYLPDGDLVSLAGSRPEAWLKPLHEVIQALEYLHQQGIVHRDLKAAHVLFASDGSVRLIDFASAMPVGAAWTTGGTSRAMVHPGRGDVPVGPADDVYALACLLHEMLHGSVPGALPPATGTVFDQELEGLISASLNSPYSEGQPPLGSYRTVIESLLAGNRNGS